MSGDRESCYGCVWLDLDLSGDKGIGEAQYMCVKFSRTWPDNELPVPFETDCYEEEET